ncbi:acyl-CoA dehydrogenase [Sphingomonas sp.]|uniref:acyl-CoA dehydrogenase n=1 Tax=Sphingomonas sp. TaxID=28214 RepID=UPI003F6F80B6
MAALLNLALSDDQMMLQETVARLFREQSTPERIRAAEGGFDKALWASVCELGLPLMRAPESAGGLSLSLLDVALVAEEAGRNLASIPLVEAIVATRLAGQFGADALVAEVAGGGAATIALHPAARGRQQVVPALAGCAFAIALNGERLIAHRNPVVEASANWTSMSALGAWVPPASPGDGDLVLAEGPDAVAAWQSAVEEWKLGSAATLAGISLQALRLAAEYAGEREQFGRRIGSFQGVAHPLADAATDSDGARLLVWQAISAIAADAADAAAQVSMAYWWATQASGRATEAAIRTFGGYGVSLENDIQLYYRRAKALSLVAGDPENEVQRVGDRLWSNESVALPDAGEIGIEFGWGSQAEAYADKLRQFMAENVDDELRAKIHHSTKAHSKPFAQKLAKAGLLYPHLPAEFGGEGRSPIELAAADAVWEEMDWNRTASGVTEFVLQLEMKFGSDEAKQEIIPRLASGEGVGCLGFTEPGAGSDIFGTSFKAVQDGGEWVLNGQKMFTTAGHIADYILLLTRTDASGKKHEGLTVFILPMDVPGIEIQPVHTLQDERTNITFFQDVRIPDKYRLGAIGGGMQVMHTMLGLEHGGIVYHYAMPVMLRHAVNWASRGEAGARRIDDPNVRRRLARAATIVAVSEGISRRDVWAQATGNGAISDGPMSKLFSTEGLRSAAADLVALAAPESLLSRDEDLALVEVAMRRAIAMTIYGGTSEIQRSLIAEQFLKMPKSRT